MGSEPNKVNMPDVIQVSRIDFGQESLSGLELGLILERLKRLEAQGTQATTLYVPYAVTDPTWITDVSNCVVFYGLTANTTITSTVLENTSTVFRIGNNSAYSLTLSSTSNTFTLVPHEFATARYVNEWVYVTGIN